MPARALPPAGPIACRQGFRPSLYSRSNRGACASAHDRHRHHLQLPAPVRPGRPLGIEARLPRHPLVLPRRERHALVRAGRLRRLRDVRHRRDDVARLHPVHLRAEERLDSVGVAGVQPGLPHGVPLGVAAPLECRDRGGLDRDPVRQGQGGPALPPHRRDLRPGERGGLPVLCLQGHREVRDGVPALAALRQPVRAHPDVDHRLLRGQGRDVQRRDHRGDPVLHPRDVVHRPRHHRHVEGDPRHAAAGRSRRMGQPVLRLAARPRLAARSSSR